MKHYIGTKEIQARPMNRGEYNEYRGWPIPADESAQDEGYLVKYSPDGYESWSPKQVFEQAYRETSGMNFGLAIEAMKIGFRVSRAGWNGKGMYVFLAACNELNTDADLSEFADQSVKISDLFVLRTAQNALQPGWLATQSDMLADDWYVVE